MPSETTTLVCAVSVAVALGVACGVWVNARFAAAASAAFIVHPAPAHLMPVAPRGQAVSTPSGNAEAEAADSQERVLAAGIDTPAHVSGETSEAREARPTAPGGKTRERLANDAVMATTGEAGRSGKSPGTGGAEAELRAGRSRVVPCALYASAGSLTIREGGAAGLVVGGPGERGRVKVTTPDWSDIAVFSEGPAGHNEWVRYSVRSVSKKPGVYTVRLTMPCGSQNIPVTVVR